MSHLPVLLHETLEGLAITPGGVYVDCTVNRAGHSYEIAKLIGKNGTLIAFDLDQDALDEARKKIAALQDAPTVHFIHSNFRFLAEKLEELKIEKVNGVLADLGLSSQELDSSGRGFSFRFDEPLLMTFDARPGEGDVTARDIVNAWKEESIADILYGFADETYARRIARAIADARKKEEIRTTQQLVDIIASAVPAPYRHRKTHFATKTFQALRMATNDELGSIKDLCRALPSVLASGGRAAIITFHSTEDRLVKTEFRNSPELRLITKKAIMPSNQELHANPRAASAQLRIAERI